MARKPEDLLPHIVVVNPDEDCTASASHDVLAEILRDSTQPAIPSLNAAKVIRKLRSATA